MPPPDHVRAELSEGSERRATPFTRTWYASGLVLGVVLMLGGIFPRWEPSLAVATLPDWVSLIVGVTITAGSVLLIYGSSSRVLLSLSWALEQSGCTVAGAGWLAFAVAAAWAYPMVFVPWVMALTMTISLMVRWRSLRRREEVTRAVVESVQGDGDV